MKKATKGHWEIKTPNNSNQIITSEFGDICEILAPFGTDEAEANALLIQKSPAMYRLINNFLSTSCVDMNRMVSIRDEAREIIKQIKQ